MKNLLSKNLYQWPFETNFTENETKSDGFNEQESKVNEPEPQPQPQPETEPQPEPETEPQHEPETEPDFGPENTQDLEEQSQGGRVTRSKQRLSAINQFSDQKVEELGCMFSIHDAKCPLSIYSTAYPFKATPIRRTFYTVEQYVYCKVYAIITNSKSAYVTSDNKIMAARLKQDTERLTKVELDTKKVFNKFPDYNICWEKDPNTPPWYGSCLPNTYKRILKTGIVIRLLQNEPLIAQLVQMGDNFLGNVGIGGPGDFVPRKESSQIMLELRKKIISVWPNKAKVHQVLKDQVKNKTIG